MKKNYFFVLAAIVALTLSACVTDEKPAPLSTSINYHFIPDTLLGAGTVSFSTLSANWTVEKAGIVFGEIGVHWEEPFAPRSTELLGANLRHDTPGGRPSPKIRDFFAIDLLKSQQIQKLTVEAGTYSHIHMIVTNDLYVFDVLNNPAGVRNIDAFAELKGGRSYYFSGKVSGIDGGEERDFEIFTAETFSENDIGDMMFRASIYDNESYSFYMSPRLEKWFSLINFANLTYGENGKILINENNNQTEAQNFKGFLAENDFMLLQIKRDGE